MVAKQPEVMLLLDQSLGWLQRSGERGTRVAGVSLTPPAHAALARMKDAGVRVGIVVPEKVGGKSVALLRTLLAPLADRVEPGSRGRRRKLPPAGSLRAWFVGADRVWRAAAENAGYRAVPHLRLAELEIAGRRLQFARIQGRRAVLERLSEGVPYDLERRSDGAWSVLGAYAREALAAAIEYGCAVQALPLDIAREDAFWIQVPQLDARGKKELPGLKVLLAEPERLLIALGPERLVDELAFHGAHGHFQLLVPSTELLLTPRSTAELDFRRWPGRELEVEAVVIDPDILGRLLSPCPATPASLQGDVDRYSGVSSLNGGGPVVSRHTRHPDNPRAVDGLLADLRAIGYCAYTHSFVFDGGVHHNVIADLPGVGYWVIKPEILKRVRDILIRWPLLGREALAALSGTVGRDAMRLWKLERLSPLEARRHIEKTFGLRPCFPWWLRLCPLPGPGAQIVIVGCHMDSTGARDPGYDAATDGAPGADDDASGIAGTLAIARALWSLRGKLRHTVRFCFFNAEESGLVGSKAYSAMLKAAGAPLRAVVCMDMIGYNGDSHRSWEIHAGYTDPAVRDLSVPIATTVQTWGTSLGALGPGQVYSGTNPSAGADRNVYDGAINRSDHSAFHQQGYPAVVVSEDFFVNLASEPAEDPNPNYHQGDDTVIDPAFASDIVCAVSMAVRELAQG